MTIKIIGQWIAFYRQRIAASSWARKEMDIEILTTSRNGDTKIYQNRASQENKEAEPFGPVQMNIYQSKIYRKDPSWFYFNDGPRVQERQQLKDQQYYISIFVAY